MKEMFSEGFLSTPVSAVASAIKTDGVFCAHAALTEDFINLICADVARTGDGLNRNWISAVYKRDQLFLCHMFAVSRAFVKFSTHPRFFELFDRVLGNTYRLKAHRYYETYGGHHMQWHTDNKTERGFAHIPGLIVLAYVSDVEDGEFQFVQGSHQWSGETGHSDYMDQFVEKNCRKDILSFKGPSGTLIMYDTYGIHRAKPAMKDNFVRKSILFQVDGTLEASEPLLINPEYIDILDDRTKRYLGFGQPSGITLYPQTDLGTMPTGKQYDILRRSIGQLMRKVARTPAKLIPMRLKGFLTEWTLQTNLQKKKPHTPARKVEL